MRLAFALCTIVLVVSCTASEGDQSKGNTCNGPLGPPIPATELDAMTPCCQAEQGHAHCLAMTNVPAEIQPLVAQCDAANACIPDSFLETGASQPPQQCTAFGGAGVCLSKCIPQVAQNEGLLRPDVCQGADELCVPCISPLDNMPTHACDLLTLATCVGATPGGTQPATCDDPNTCNYEANCPPVIDPASLDSCGADAHCLDAALISDQAEAAKLGKCTNPAKLCVPDVFIRTGGKFTPATCTSVAGAEGRCLSAVLPDVAKQAALLPQDICAATEKCTPCYNPIDGTSTGACSLSCDAGPTKPPVTFAACCSARAHCVPTDAVPQAEQSNLGNDSCANTDLCVPDQLLLGQTIPTCTANSFILGDYTGVCLSDCLDFGIQGIALARGSCSNNFTCAPCTQNGQPTGAPGCPP